MLVFLIIGHFNLQQLKKTQINKKQTTFLNVQKTKDEPSQRYIVEIGSCTVCRQLLCI